MTANAFGEDRLACEQAGMQDHTSLVDRRCSTGRCCAGCRAAPKPPRTRRRSDGGAPTRAGTGASEPVHGLDESVLPRYFAGRIDVYERVLKQSALAYRDGIAALNGPLVGNAPRRGASSGAFVERRQRSDRRQRAVGACRVARARRARRHRRERPSAVTRSPVARTGEGGERDRHPLLATPSTPCNPAVDRMLLEAELTPPRGPARKGRLRLAGVTTQFAGCAAGTARPRQSRRLRGRRALSEFAQALQVLRELRAAQRENHVDA